MQFIKSIDIGKLANHELSYCQVSFNVEYYTEGLYEIFRIEKAIELERASVQRRAEYIASRYAIRLVFDLWNMPNPKIPNASHQAPQKISSKGQEDMASHLVRKRHIPHELYENNHHC
ncbi:hypothetical protein [Martelella alba]|uniref:Uncharacterized protein n=1 Tax=Martelella alba TaxID=2590451 RepID=A0ABY2SEH2_9HYPH|nr:hypothetical protein [Martelella alba]TKI03176.1 hypothetical protein FCN80_22625 [Martelella alba]